MDEIAAGNVVWLPIARPACGESRSRDRAGVEKGGGKVRTGSKKKPAAERTPLKNAPQDEAQTQSCRHSSSRNSRRWSTRRQSGDEWLHEIKYDGYRVIAAVGGGEVAIYTRNGLDWTDKFARVVRRCATCRARPRCSTARSRSPTRTAIPISARCRTRCPTAAAASAYYLFDLLYLDGEDLRACR